MRPSPLARGAAVIAVALLALTAFMATKYFAADAFMMRAWLAWAVAALALGLVALVGWAVRARAIVAAPTVVVLAAILFVVVMESPFEHEVGRVAAALPHPPGATRAHVVTGGPFERGHPTAFATWTYAESANLTELTEATARALRDAGWNVTGATPPGGRLGELGFVQAARGPYRVSCTIGMGAGVPTLDCALRV